VNLAELVVSETIVVLDDMQLEFLVRQKPLYHGANFLLQSESVRQKIIERAF
jgi:hypothetical protein